MKVRLKLATDEDHAIWASAQRASLEVASWPAWKRGHAAVNVDPLELCEYRLEKLAGQHRACWWWTLGHCLAVGGALTARIRQPPRDRKSPAP